MCVRSDRKEFQELPLLPGVQLCQQADSRAPEQMYQIPVRSLTCRLREGARKNRRQRREVGETLYLLSCKKERVNLFR